jgi:hypothetical protein
LTVLGELGLDGSIAAVAGVLPAAIGANARGEGLICPSLCGAEGCLGQPRNGDHRGRLADAARQPLSRHASALSPAAQDPRISAQRYWLAGALILAGLFLAHEAFEWSSSRPSEDDERALVIFASSKGQESAWSKEEMGTFLRNREVQDLSDKELKRVYASYFRRSGIYIRAPWGRYAVFWGGLLPLCLFAAAGFIAFKR